MLLGASVAMLAVGSIVFAFCMAAAIVRAFRDAKPADPGAVMVYRNPPGLGNLGKLRCYHCYCGARVATPLDCVPTPHHPACCGCGCPVYGRNLPVTIEDQALFMAELWGESR